MIIFYKDMYFKDVYLLRLLREQAGSHHVPKKKKKDHFTNRLKQDKISIHMYLNTSPCIYDQIDGSGGQNGYEARGRLRRLQQVQQGRLESYCF